MAHILTRRESGLIVAENSADERTIQRALKDFDPHLVLTWEVDPTGVQVWNVHYVESGDRPAIFIAAWRDDYGTPLPLSSSLVDKVKSLRAGVDWVKVADEENRRLVERRRREAESDMDQVAAEYQPYIDDRRSFGFRRGVKTRMFRDKLRARGINA